MKPTRTPTPIIPNIEDCEWTPSVAHLFRRHYILQTPMYFLRCIYAVFYSLYLLFVLKAPTDADIVRSDEYEVTVGDCKMRATGGFHLKRMSMRYKKGEDGDQVLWCTRNGVEISDSLVRHIVDRDLKTLQVSTYTTIPLHYGLLHSSISVLNGEGIVPSSLGYGGVGIKESLLEETRNMSAWEGHQSGRRWDLLGKESLLYKLFRASLCVGARPSASDRSGTAADTSRASRPSCPFVSWTPGRLKRPPLAAGNVRNCVGRAIK
ncbi:Hypp1083 [Branchiostoma lanceolatum]|uniref:Hypp1083 protein n=1 Tax=Branchiostoma lanceolatum TaxID=7740 RepID=A0A8K0EIY4_BRALA|nr:Hypp1083 [Branchiostoma lanceolatum]